jgi:hypothetical protein
MNARPTLVAYSPATAIDSPPPSNSSVCPVAQRATIAAETRIAGPPDLCRCWVRLATTAHDSTIETTSSPAVDVN